MARHWFGGGLADWAFFRVDGISGHDGIPQLAPGAELTMWNLPSGETQHTDLLVDGAPASVVVTGEGSAAGQIPRFQGPPGVGAMWADAGGGSRALMLTTDLYELVVAALTEGGLEQLHAHESEPNPHATRLGDLSNVDAGPSGTLGQVLGRVGEDQWAAVTVEGLAPVQSVDGMTGAVELAARYVRRALLGLAPGQLTEPVLRVEFDHVPGVDGTDLIMVTTTHPSAGPQTHMWMNERGMLRLEQRVGARFDNMYLAIMDGAANPAESGWPFRIERRDNGQRQLIGGLDPRGRYETSLFPWMPIDVIDPDGTGRYAASTVVGPAPLQARQETTDIVRLQGRLAATEVVAGDTLLTLPAGLLPLSQRLVGVRSEERRVGKE